MSPYDDGWLLDLESCGILCPYSKHVSMRPYDEPFTACAKAALENDFDPVPWAEAPDWRRTAAYAVADAALNTNNPDFARSAWFLAMTSQGWRWDRVYDEEKKTHPGLIVGELTGGGTKHWANVVAQVRKVGRLQGVLMTGP